MLPGLVDSLERMSAEEVTQPLQQIRWQSLAPVPALVLAARAHAHSAHTAGTLAAAANSLAAERTRREECVPEAVVVGRSDADMPGTGMP